MKLRTIITIALLIAMAAAVFFMGWIQIQLEADTYGVIFTKTGGFDPEIARPGAFLWSFAKLLPTNFTLEKYHVVPRRAELVLRGELPSGTAYSSSMEIPTDFSYDLLVSVTYRLRPEFLPSLRERDGLLPADLDGWYGLFEDRLKTSLFSFLDAFFSGEEPEWSRVALHEAAVSMVQMEYPSVEILNLSATSATLPDPRLYAAVRKQLLAQLEERGKVSAAAAAAAAAKAAELGLHLQTLALYGELFRKYPELLQYFAIENGKPELLGELLTLP